jgi:hypothetical protein
VLAVPVEQLIQTCKVFLEKILFSRLLPQLEVVVVLVDHPLVVMVGLVVVLLGPETIQEQELLVKDLMVVTTLLIFMAVVVEVLARLVIPMGLVKVEMVLALALLVRL